jgi:lysyl-tRNA synthetase class 2
VPESIADDIDSLLDLGMSLVICHQLTADCYTCITDYPASQASLARIERHDDFAVACRFEFYYGSLELANGYHELTDATEQRQRFEADNNTRRERGLPAMAVDESLLAAMHAGLPDCAGVAIGVDRLLMILMPEVDHLQQLIAFNWERA